MRCGIGNGLTKLEVFLKPAGSNQNAQVFRGYENTVSLSWHQEDNTVEYAIGTMLLTPTNTPTPTPTPTGTVLPTPTPVLTPTPTPTPTPNPAVIIPTSIPVAVSAWETAVATSTPGITFCEGNGCGTSNSDGGVVTINVADGSSGQPLANFCGAAGIACVKLVTSDGSHRLNMTMLIEQPAYSGDDQYYWTDDVTVVDGGGGSWIYLPGAVMHEFGHTWVLWHPHPTPGSSIMGGSNNAALPSSDDVKAMHAVNDGHSH